jgi:hypothetical protein
MPIAYNRELVFIHIPKTGGTSIENSLGITNDINNLMMFKKLEHYNVCPQHIYASEILELHPECKHWKKFSMVRNPYTRIVSEYYYHKNYANDTCNKDVVKDMDFLQFVDYVFNLKESIRMEQFDRHIEPQYKFLDVDDIHIFRFENINDCFFHYNLIPKHNRNSNIKDYISIYTPELQQKVYNFYEEDFIQFGYSIKM